jgi:hypothetical protein
MDALANMAGQLQARPVLSPESGSKAAAMRRALQTRGQMTARELVEVARCSGTSVVGGLLKHDLHAGRVHFAEGYYSWNFDWEPPMSTTDPHTIARAFAIADEAMFELLLSEGVPGDNPASDATCIGFTNEASQEVRSLCDASTAMREAFDWLRPRGYVQLGTDTEGEFINVIRRPGED